MMKRQPKFNTVASLRDPKVRGLTYGQHFMLAPITRQEVSYRLVQERPSRKRKVKEKLGSLSELVFPADRSGNLGKA